MPTDEVSPTTIAMLIYPDFTMLDLIGPHQVLTGVPGVAVDLVAKTAEPVISDSQVAVIPTKTFADCRPTYDVLVVPGTRNTHRMVEDAETLAFLRSVSADARYVTSVCTGSLILAAAGLLTGYRATSHWAFRRFLKAYGALPEDGRIVVDRNRITGGGVTAGIDFGLHLAATLVGEDAAKVRQLVMEYDPDPPYTVGTPDRADAGTRIRAEQRLAPLVAAMAAAAERTVTPEGADHATN
ncbi:DJ-1/PfpI family protein [Mycolicibacter icosiumassiliensis]|uniref:DJ-1/PfpI family protein n=1 Tax=Mycolicibacter icosiumassiliensis TaxID=1792835 RepID=UPI00082FFC3E|nr:DJ-1/PfpI family protein [Mycolicibacter icosiumassiliensis]